MFLHFEISFDRIKDIVFYRRRKVKFAVQIFFHGGIKKTNGREGRRGKIFHKIITGRAFQTVDNFGEMNIMLDNLTICEGYDGEAAHRVHDKVVEPKAGSGAVEHTGDTGKRNIDGYSDMGTLFFVSERRSRRISEGRGSGIQDTAIDGDGAYEDDGAERADKSDTGGIRCAAEEDCTDGVCAGDTKAAGGADRAFGIAYDGRFYAGGAGEFFRVHRPYAGKS